MYCFDYRHFFIHCKPHLFAKMSNVNWTLRSFKALAIAGMWVYFYGFFTNHLLFLNARSSLEIVFKSLRSSSNDGSDKIWITADFSYMTTESIFPPGNISLWFFFLRFSAISKRRRWDGISSRWTLRTLLSASLFERPNLVRYSRASERLPWNTWPG